MTDAELRAWMASHPDFILKRDRAGFTFIPPGEARPGPASQATETDQGRPPRGPGVSGVAPEAPRPP
jgi:hypothetical protein